MLEPQLNDQFVYTANVPWCCDHNAQIDWITSIDCAEQCLFRHLGHDLWQWHDQGMTVRFKQPAHRLMFVMVWAHS
jgi:hypothetical protein